MDFYVILLIAIGILAAAAAANSRSAAAWTAAAKILGVTYTKKGALSNARLSGSVEGMDLVVTAQTTGNTKVTRYVVSYPSIGIGLTIARKGGFAKLTELFGGPEEQSDDPFDRMVSVKTSDPQQLPLFLTPRIREVVMDLLTNLPAAKVQDDSIVFERRNVDRQTTQIVTTSRLLIAAAREISGVSAQPRRAAPLPPDPYASTASMTDLPRPPADSAPPEMEPAEPDTTLSAPSPSYEASSSDTTTPSSTAPSYDATLPSQEAATPAYDSASYPSVLSEQQNILDTPPTPVESGTELDVASVAGELFGGDMLSFEAAAMFDQQYSGRRVRWTATVVTRIGSRVRADVGTIETTLFGPVTIGVVVDTPAKVEPEDSVIIEGALVGIDALERTFTVDGSVKRA
jgi:hypothetical protein